MKAMYLYSNVKGYDPLIVYGKEAIWRPKAKRWAKRVVGKRIRKSANREIASQLM